MDKRYLIYWRYKNINVDGNIIMEFDPKKVFLKDLIKSMIISLNREIEGEYIKNLVIKFMIELKWVILQFIY